MNLIPYAITLFGTCYVVGYSLITLHFRKWLSQRNDIGHWIVELLQCPACFSWWIGLLFAIIERKLAVDIAGPFFSQPIQFAFLSLGIGALLGIFTGLLTINPE